jgi:hypothetical protein
LAGLTAASRRGPAGDPEGFDRVFAPGGGVHGDGKWNDRGVFAASGLAATW